MIQTQEVELKLEIPSGEIETLRAVPLLGDPKRRPESQRTVYYDTLKGDLRKAGYSLRLRQKERSFVQTVKHRGSDSGGFSSRAEWEKKNDEAALDFEALKATPVGKLLSKRDMRKRLQPVSETRVLRTMWLVRREESAVELILDEGRIVSNGREEAISEIELELKEGPRSELFKLARELGKGLTLRMGVMSKSERGFRLLEGRSARVRKADKVRLAPGMSVGEAFAVVVQSCLRHFRLNEPLFARDMNARALHQSRVALRRLRSALSLFKPALIDDEAAHLRAELRWYAALLGEARDVDVLLAAKGPDGRASARGARKLLRQARTDAYARVQAALGEPRLPAAILDLVAWSEVGAWRSGEPAGEPIAGFATDRLERGWKRVRRPAKALRSLDPEARHRLRIEMKKLRYAAEFFVALAPRSRKRQQKRFISQLQRLQDLLGKLNDIETRRQLAPELFEDGAAVEEAQVEGLIEESERAWKALAEIGPYWR
ncbi:MAG TPA: CHAD domain-containing protein [Allosphingosinicella sp.]|nr:CHAD domain-containing protein [Allosphingosinicella sp.]